jgi:hypothetical protein
MEQIIIKLKDQSKRNFLLELLAQFDFLELQVKQVSKDKSKEEKEDSYDFFQSAGLFEGRDIDADQLRKEAWRLYQPQVI